MLNFNVIKFFCVNIRTGKILHPLSVRREFPSSDCVKINTDGVARGYPGLAPCESIFVENMGKFIGVFSVFFFFKFRLLWLLSFMGLYMLWKNIKRCALLMS